MDGFFEEAFLQELLVFAQTVEFVIQAIRTGNSASAVQLRFSENESQDGNEQVDPGNTEHLGFSQGEILFQLLNNCRRIVLAPIKIKKRVRIEVGWGNVRSGMKAGFKQNAKAPQFVLSRKVNTNQ
jgi:hypothetical protein